MILYFEEGKRHRAGTMIQSNFLAKLLASVTSHRIPFSIPSLLPGQNEGMTYTDRKKRQESGEGMSVAAETKKAANDLPS